MDGYRAVVALAEEAQAAAARGDWSAAILANGRAISAARALGRPRLLAVLFNRMGLAQENTGNIQDALGAYEAGVRSLGDDPSLDIADVLRSLSSVGKRYYEFDRWDPPDLYSAQAGADLAQAEADATLLPMLLVNVGNMYLRQIQIDPALNAYQQALAQPAIANAPRLHAHALTHVGVIRRQQGDIAAAESLLEQAMSGLRVHAELADQRRGLQVLAGIYRDRGETERSRRTYDQALALISDVHEPRGEGRTRAGLALLELQHGRFAEAEPEYRRALELATESGDGETAWHAAWGLGRCLGARGDYENAAAAFRRSLQEIATRQQDLRTDEGKVTFLRSVQDVFDDLVGVHLERAKTDPAAFADALAEAENARGRALRDFGRRRRPAQNAGVRSTRLQPFENRQASPAVPTEAEDTSFDPSVQMARGVWSPAAGEHAPWAQMAPGVPSGPDSSIADQLRQSAPGVWIEDSVTWDPPMEHEPEAPVEAPVPPPPLARLVFHVLDDMVACWTVATDGRIRGHTIAWPRAELAHRVAALRDALRVDGLERGTAPVAIGPEDEGGESLDQDDTRVFRTRVHRTNGGMPAALLQELYAALVAPLADTLPQDGTPVVVEPHAELWLLPFAALQAEDGSWMADKWSLLYSPSWESLDEIRLDADYGVPATLTATIVGNPVMPELPPLDGMAVTLRPLPGAEEEAIVIADLLPQRTLLLREAATKAAVVEQVPTCGILHLATHGIAFADDPLSSLVALTPTAGGDGVLTAREVISWSLPADLVVLSACQTGLGQISGEGVIGLSRAFLIAGARSVLVSQWSVSDRATVAVMRAFYREYIRVDNKASALQAAMKEVRAIPRFAHPRFWAAFVVVGAEA